MMLSKNLNAQPGIAIQILNFAHQQGLQVGDHLPAQRLANALALSRTPVNQALAALALEGWARQENNRGYFLAKSLPSEPLASVHTDDDVVRSTYRRVADDLLTGELAVEQTESALRQRYGLGVRAMQSVLRRISEEGWVEKKPGYGWRFSKMLTSAESLMQSYRLRLALEPAALREPGYRLDPTRLRLCREAEWHLLRGGILTDSAEQLHERGVQFHETLVEASGNPYFVDTLRRVNAMRRLISYRSTRNRHRYEEHCHQHLQVLELLERGEQDAAAHALHQHLETTLLNHQRIAGLLQTAAHED
jgi:DNA-binding GntR family transcriptional regulator